jgi:phenylpyruvate tautomerase PptA (4-oxalocrotonate tautomerase family)
VLADATAAVRAVAPDAEVWVRCHDVPEGAWGAGGVAVDLGASQALLGAS